MKNIYKLPLDGVEFNTLSTWVPGVDGTGQAAVGLQATAQFNRMN